MPLDLIDRYCEVRERDGEWPTPIPYMSVPELRDLCCFPPLLELLDHLIGEPCFMHLNLTGWVSTERNWHQDDYLNPPHAGVNCHYAAVWFALDDIDPECGVFEYVPGSHRWPWVRQEKVLAQVDAFEASSPDWPKRTERFVVPAVEAEIARRGDPVEQFIPKKGDILIWHGALVHRGSAPKRPGLQRKALITHYSGIHHRKDMGIRNPKGYFEL